MPLILLRKATKEINLFYKIKLSLSNFMKHQQKSDKAPKN